jgi:hypothetical protein
VTITSATPSAVAVPVIKTVSSESAQVKPKASVPASPVKTEAENLMSQTAKEVSGDEKINLKEKSVTNIINLASPKPTASPLPQLPQGGKLSFKNFSLFGFKK